VKQQCHVAFIYLQWIVYIGGALFLASRSQYLVLLFWLVFIPLTLWTFVRGFPRISNLMGYGSVADQEPAKAGSSETRVVVYTALGCPFCPLIEQRLEALQKKMGFKLEKIDVTLRPDLLAAKGIRSVPAVEVGNALITGLATTSQLAAVILGRSIAS
jgi:thiol-disulfide isomerase/thioredoxin